MIERAEHEEGRRLLSDRRRRGISLLGFGLERRAGRDRRASPRMALEIGCEGETGGEWFFRRSADLSLTGISLPSGMPHATGSIVSLRLFLPDGNAPLAVDAIVIGPYDANGGMRLQFCTLAPEQTFRLASTLLLCTGAAARAA